jgi:hypothetical protein
MIAKDRPPLIIFSGLLWLLFSGAILAMCDAPFA